jgi:glycosyltransferase involved in cell wall biosynthesis
VKTAGARISVAIPVWNDSRWLPGAIESVLAQTYQNWELVIGDNASSEDLAGIVSRYADPRYADAPALRARVRRLMLSHARLGSVRAGDPAGTINVNLGGREMSFRTDPALVNAWQPVLAAHPLPAGASERTLVRHLNQVADSVILSAGAVPNSPAFGQWFTGIAAAQDPTVASQGIVVGGRNSPDVRIKNNTIEGRSRAFTSA